ncbi:MAG TPA: iron-containing alcohol dehydrogenase [Victivallales bacterium]|nr:iron-containing alcohol dehydrogenase [Victivallales bacterium]
MQNFTYYNPVNIVFGKGTISELSNLVPKDTKILMTYGGGSIKKNGVYNQVKKALKGYSVLEFSGIEPNPTYETCMKAVKLIKENDIDFLLSVGGGSVLDGTKFIAAATEFSDGDPWKILSEAAEIKSAIPLGCVITLPATGSEMNCYSVVSKKSTNEKFALNSEQIYPTFSIIDPETTFSLPKKQVINGLVDTFVHTLEQYITYRENAPLQERQAESILITIIEIAQKVLNEPKNYEARANFFWCATQALNGLISCGVPQDWATHMIGHELTALYGIDHGQSLAVILPRVWCNQKENKADKLLQYGRRVFNITDVNRDTALNTIINKTEDFFQSLGIKTTLSEYGIDPEEAAEKISSRFKERGALLGEKEKITPDYVKEILLKC